MRQVGHTQTHIRTGQREGTDTPRGAPGPLLDRDAGIPIKPKSYNVKFNANLLKNLTTF